MEIAAGTWRILLIDDDRFQRRVVEATLRKAGHFNVMTAVDGEEGLNVALAEPPDLILLDLIMPKLNGFEVLRQLRDTSTTAAIPVIVMSSLGQESDQSQARATGATGYFIKNQHTLKELVEQIHKLLGQER